MADSKELIALDTAFLYFWAFIEFDSVFRDRPESAQIKTFF